MLNKENGFEFKKKSENNLVSENIKDIEKFLNLYFENPENQSSDLLELYIKITSLDIISIRDNESNLPSEQQLEYIRLYQRIKNFLKDKKVIKFEHLSRLMSDIKDVLIKTNKRLVVSIIIKNCPERLRKKFFEDLISEGNLGLQKAIENFDLNLGYQLSTYATWWIKQKIGLFIKNHGLLIRIPVHLHVLINEILKEVNEVRQNDNGKANIEEVIAKYVEDPQKAKLILDTIQRRKIISLDEPLENKDGDERTGYSIYKDKSTSKIEEEIFNKIELEDITKILLNELKPKSAAIFLLRSEIYDKEKKTLEEIAKLYGLTKERVRQIFEQAKKKLVVLYSDQKNAKHPQLKKEYYEEDYKIFVFDFIKIPQLLYDNFNQEDLDKIHNYFGIFNNWQKKTGKESNELKSIKKKLTEIYITDPITKTKVTLLAYFKEKNNPTVVLEANLEKKLKYLLSPREYQIFILYYKNQFRVSQISERLKLEQTTCNKFLYTASKKLKGKAVRLKDENLIPIKEYLKLKKNSIDEKDVFEKITEILNTRQSGNCIKYIQDYYGFSGIYPKPSIRQIAKMYGVANTTVLRVLNTARSKFQNILVKIGKKTIPLNEYLDKLRNPTVTTPENFTENIKKILSAKQYQTIKQLYGLDNIHPDEIIWGSRNNNPYLQQLARQAKKNIKDITVKIGEQTIPAIEYLESLKNKKMITDEKQIEKYLVETLISRENKNLKIKILNLRFGLIDNMPKKANQIQEMLLKEEIDIKESEVTRLLNYTLKEIDRQDAKIKNEDETQLLSSFLLNKLELPSIILYDKLWGWIKFLLSPKQLTILTLYLEYSDEEEFYQLATNELIKKYNKKYSKKSIYASITGILNRFKKIDTKVKKGDELFTFYEYIKKVKE